MGSKETLHSEVQVEAKGRGGRMGVGPEGRLLEEVTGPQRAGAPEGRPGAKGSPSPQAQVGLGQRDRRAGAPHSHRSRGCLLKTSQLYAGWERSNQRDNGQIVYDK